MKKLLLFAAILFAASAQAQTTDTTSTGDKVRGVVIYLEPSAVFDNVQFGKIGEEEYREIRYTAIMTKDEQGVHIQTAYGWIDVTKQYTFIPFSNMQKPHLSKHKI